MELIGAPPGRPESRGRRRPLAVRVRYAGSGPAAPRDRWRSGERLDRGVDLRADLVGERRVADLLEALSGSRSTAKCVRKALSSVGLAGVQALGADDLVGDQDDRVGPGLLGRRSRASGARSLPVPSALAAATALPPTRRSARPAPRAVVDLRDAQVVVLGVGPLDVGDATLGGLDAPAATPADFSLPSPTVPATSCDGSAVQAPSAAACEVLLEVLGGAGLVGAEEDLDRRRPAASTPGFSARSPGRSRS